MNKVISIVTPCFDEIDNVEHCRQAVVDLFNNQLSEYDHEHIFCDNASTDGTGSFLREMAAKDSRVKVVINARNFGALRNIFNGMQYATGDACVPMLPADLQDPPERIVDFVQKWEAGYQVVYGIRREREESLIPRLLRDIFYRVVNRWSPFEIPIGAGEFQLIDRVVLDEVTAFEDYHPYIRGMIAFCGFSTTGVPYVWKKRRRGKSKISFSSLVDQGLNAIISFSAVPTRLALGFGFILAILSVLAALSFFVVNLIYFREFAPPGIALLTVGLFFFAGIQLLFLGLMGEYLLAIHSQVRKKPIVIERELINIEGLGSGSRRRQQ